ncbi:aminopeptidase N [Synechococcus sp. HJ21-Hayes]|uniref:aminopeptidase N n=1 Tax=unclassified Synechococcus TaxID=2626047 RepID=UPI0020CF685F|nr:MULTISPECIES: aminopeptidase N [unclassified Synechococcus]MCP9831917.1 aminopeptidase N [Synechococcus sp. JJ3a-Johnson]MCP9853520.1 aminopeptidase N [Synechococcus sp. HJ21-Hayes]
MATVRLADYRPAPCLIERTDLRVQLFADHSLVEAELAFTPNPAGEPGPLELRGEELELLDLALDGEALPGAAYRLESGRLVLLHPPARPFQLRSRVRIHPETNTTLEGLYVSGGLFTTQCEAEGFRRITFHPDRPDLLSRFRVRIEADRESCPVLLSNGNCLETGELPGDPSRHYAIWDDPFPKPSYLFALVAGRLDEVREVFTTRSGRDVQLRIHVEPGDLPFTAHAMASLKRSMAWDEEVYGLEYDLDEFNIVAVRHFNMGAMENKSLNIFNSKLVLADAATATDAELERIESVIAHEYFHNWTGNRITCRDWFQLSLKEGLTVFRDACFTADLHSAAVKRIEDVSLLRNTQFREDAGPTAHPIQPDHYQAIDNFYTTTIYEKGAEVIRCLHTLLGEETFMRGMALYVSRHDGTAATCNEFVQAMEDAAQQSGQPRFDFQQFRRWYGQAGTPSLAIQRHWDGEAGSLSLQVRQSTPATPGQPHKDPLVIPLAMGLVGQGGDPLPLRLAGEGEAEAAAAVLAPSWGQGSRLLVMDQPEQSFHFVGLEPHSHPPALSLLRGFSAPVKLELERSGSELLHLLACDSDPFARWDAGQTLLRQAVLERAAGQPNDELEEGLVAAFERILLEVGLCDANRSALLALPGLPELEDAALALSGLADPPALFQALLDLQARFGRELEQPLHQNLHRCRQQWGLAWPQGNGDRQLTGTIWAWRVAAGDQLLRAEAADAVMGPSMTLARAGLRALQCHNTPERAAAMAAFHDRWQHKPVILDAWFGLEAAAPFGDGVARVRLLMEHPRFDPAAPNSLRAVLGGLAGNVPVFHALDGSGYRFMAEQIAAVDQRNPITASRMAKVFSRWQSYGPERSLRLREALEQLALAPLSPNTAEVVGQCLA